MLSTKSSLLCPPLIKTSSLKQSLFPYNYNVGSCRKMHGSTSWKTGVLYNGYSYFTSPCHPLQLELPKDELVEEEESSGLGIVKFFQGKNIFLTGATGLLGKVLLEKILRSTPVGKVYLLIKAKDDEDALQRLTKEIINSNLFECLRKKHGPLYEDFVREKMIPVVGNICEPNMGMSSECIDAIRRDVQVIIQSAASTTLNERYDVLLAANMSAPQRLMRFAKTCKNLKLFTHISTAYVNGKREGIISEEPLVMGDNRRKEEKEDNLSNHTWPKSCARLDLADEINMIFKSSMASTDYDATKNLKKLGQERADFFGWYNTYHLTKAIGEMVLDEIRGEVPVLIIRPTVIESSYKEPIPGWIQGNRMFDPVILSYGKGQLPAFFGNPEVTMDIIPVDMLANTTIAAIANEGINAEEPKLKVYQVATSVANPLKYSDFFEYLYEYFNSAPLRESQSISRIEYFDNFNDFSRYTREEMSLRAGSEHTVASDKQNIQNRCKAKVAYAEQLCKLYEFVGFHNGNTEKLIGKMSNEEQVEFEINARKIDWKMYFQEVHVPGLRKHILNGPRASSPST
ncbi:fatty acyl-CoA reductase 2 [Striga asiatica]|uniref:Fatty acyl-CoA reductase n=1 Tax=Striga asiatica TaxID=4170 RepID=A0A5A7PNF3_STRAF|nr:fatty acyl-CoA reductase 2 [Striga asiatica]